MAIIAVHVTDEEKQLLEQAAELERRLGERVATSSWVRRVALQEAARVIKEAKDAG
jgi:uncharacterized protein (DUF1778 family)